MKKTNKTKKNTGSRIAAEEAINAAKKNKNSTWEKASKKGDGTKSHWTDSIEDNDSLTRDNFLNILKKVVKPTLRQHNLKKTKTSA